MIYQDSTPPAFASKVLRAGQIRLAYALMEITKVQLNDNLTIPQTVMQRFGFKANQQVTLIDLDHLLLIDLRESKLEQQAADNKLNKRQIVREMARMRLPIFQDWQEAKKCIIQEKTLELEQSL